MFALISCSFDGYRFIESSKDPDVLSDLLVEERAKDLDAFFPGNDENGHTGINLSEYFIVPMDNMSNEVDLIDEISEAYPHPILLREALREQAEYI